MIGAPEVSTQEVAFWEKALRAAVQNPAWAAVLEQNHWTNTWKASADTRVFLDSERVFLGGMLRELGLT